MKQDPDKTKRIDVEPIRDPVPSKKPATSPAPAPKKKEPVPA